MKKKERKKNTKRGASTGIIKYFSFHDKYDKRDDTVVVAREVHPRLNVSLKFIIILRGGKKRRREKGMERKEKRRGNWFVELD